MENVKKIQNLLSKKNLDGYLIPMRDEFNSEYVPAQYQRLKYATNFTGSSGFVVILRNKSAFFTDGRYTLQSKQEVDSKVFSIFDLSEKIEIDYILENAKPNSKIGFDSGVFSFNQIKKYEEKLAAKNISLIETENLVDLIWQERPTQKLSKAFNLDVKYSGVSAKVKIQNITKDISRDIDSDYLFLTHPESICWLLNIRAHDLPNTPVLLCYALVSKKGEVTLFTFENAVPNAVSKNLFKEIKINLKNISEIEKELKKLKNKKIQIDLNSSSYKFYSLLKKSSANIIDKKDPCIKARAIKNKIELENFKQAHIKDGVALCKFIYWLENNINKNLTELSIGEKLEEFRKENKNFLFPSFDTIAGYAENGAIIHYRADKNKCKKLKKENILLLDSGGQYLEGTTDVTRTIALGKVTAEQKTNFTLVLKGHIAIASAKFPSGTSGAQLDALARISLWKNHKDYKHGTGHGVGFCLNVHEGPHGISKNYTTPLEEGMIISNEPGFYKENYYGIRIENLIFVKAAKNNFLEFETLTQVPIDTKLIDKNLLSDEEINWLNNYHAKVYKNLSQYLKPKEKQWLQKQTKRI